LRTDVAVRVSAFLGGEGEQCLGAGEMFVELLGLGVLFVFEEVVVGCLTVEDCG
jgi:hypothetical protein